MRISDWSSDVYSSDLLDCPAARQTERCDSPTAHSAASGYVPPDVPVARPGSRHETVGGQHDYCRADHDHVARTAPAPELARSDEQPSELQSLMRISYAVLCLKTTKHKRQHTNIRQ